MSRRPWLWLLLATPCALTIWWFACAELRRVHRLADYPERVSTAEGLQRARGEVVWVELTDVAFDCEHSVLLGEHRYGLAQATGIPADTALILSADDALCPAPDAVYAGIIERLEAGDRRRAIEQQGVSAPSLWQLSIVRRRSDLLTKTIVLLFVGACVQLLGFFGYLKMKTDRRALARRQAPLSRELLLQRLSCPPLRLRPGFLFARFVLPSLLLVFFLAIGALLIWVPTTELEELRAERERWARATPTDTLGPPSLVLKRKIFTTLLFADVEVSFRALAAPQLKASVQYGVLWYPKVEPPYLVKHDARGTLTSVGLALVRERAGMDVVILVLGLGFALACAHHARKLVRQQLAFRAVTASPRVMFRPLQQTEILRHNGLATGQIAYTFVAPSGESIQQLLNKPRAPVFDLDETNVLVVTAFDDPGAEPILVADDGYPFMPPS